MTRWFFDTEFIDTGRAIDLISIGMISEDGRQTYSACLLESWGDGWSEAKMGPWHIFPKMDLDKIQILTSDQTEEAFKARGHEIA